jgi:uncharacterized protein YuzE
MDTKKLWIDYDEEADVLYISFQRPQQATDSEMLDNGILLRYRKEKLVGVAVLDASARRFQLNYKLPIMAN